MGTPRQSCIVICGNCGCRHESSDEDEHSGTSWNTRAALAQPAEPVARVRIHKTGGNAGLAWSAVPVEDAPLMRDGDPLYAAPQPPATVAQSEPIAYLYRDQWGVLKLAQTMPPPVGSFPVFTERRGAA